MGVRADAADPHSVAVGLRVGDALRAGDTAGAADVFDHDLLAQNSAHALRHEPAEHVLRSTGRKRDDHGHRPRWIGLRPSEAQHSRQRGSARGQREVIIVGGEVFHDAPSGDTKAIRTVAEAVPQALPTPSVQRL